MSETFEKVLVKDDRLGCITSKVKFQVLKGGAEYHLSTVHSHLTDQRIARVECHGAKLGNYYKQGGALEVNSNS